MYMLLYQAERIASSYRIRRYRSGHRLFVEEGYYSINDICVGKWGAPAIYTDYHHVHEISTSANTLYDGSFPLADGMVITTPSLPDESLLRTIPETKVGTYIIETEKAFDPLISDVEWNQPPVVHFDDVGIWWYHEGELREVPLDIRPFLEMEIPMTVFIEHPDRVNPGQILYPWGDRYQMINNIDAPTIDELYDLFLQGHLREILTLPPQPLYERVMTIMSNKRIRSATHDKKSIVLICYDKEGKPLSPLTIAMRSDLLFPPPSKQLMQRYHHEIFSGILLLDRALSQCIPSIPCPQHWPDEDARRIRSISSGLEAVLLLNAALLKHGEQSIPNLEALISKQLPGGGESPMHYARRYARDEVYFYSGRNVVYLKDMFRRSGRWLWSSGLILDGVAYPVSHTSSGCTVLINTLVSPKATHQARAQEALASIVGEV